MENNNPLSPHLQIYKWQISSLLSITHRIVGVINFFAIILICFWAILIIFGQNNYSAVNFFLNTSFGNLFLNCASLLRELVPTIEPAGKVSNL